MLRTDFVGSFAGYLALAVKKYPLNIFLESNDITYSFEKVDSITNNYSNYLSHKGVTPNDVVAIDLKSNSRKILSLLSLSKVGATFIVISDSYSDEKKQAVLKKVGAKYIISESDIPGFNRLDFRDELFEKNQPQKFAYQLEPEDPAYIIFTSGSTGDPKAILVKNIGIPTIASNIIDKLEVYCHSRVLQMSASSFDAFIFELLMALVTGACLVFRPTEFKLPGSGFEAFVEKKRITHILSTPSFLTSLHYSDISSLKCLYSVGESCPINLRELVPNDITLFNLYGPSESTIWSTYYKIDSKGQRAVPIGSPISGIDLFLKDEFTNSRGTQGVLCIGGLPSSSEYIGGGNEKFYKKDTTPYFETGDIVLRREDGLYEFVGRVDKQVKIRGYRVDTAEVENEICKVCGVKIAYVIDNGQPLERKALVAFLISSMPISNHLKFFDDIKSHLEMTLPNYSIPSHFHLILNSPKTRNGKVDIDELLNHHWRCLNSSKSVKKDVITKIWCDVLGVGMLSSNDNFFKIGGNSLLGVKLVKKVSQMVGYNIGVDVIYQNPTLEEFKTAVKNINYTIISKPVIPNKLSEYPLSYQQKRILSKCLMDECSSAYNVCGYYSFFEIEPERLKNIINDKLYVDKFFNFFLEEKDREFIFTLTDSKSSSCNFIDLTHLSTAESKSFIEDFVYSESRKQIDLFGQLFVVFVFKTSINECSVFLKVHHIIWDGHSEEIFWKDVLKKYEDENKNEISEFCFGDYAVWQLESDGDSQPEKDCESIWGEGLENAKMISFTEYTGQSIVNGSIRIPFVIKNDTTTKLNKYCRQQSITPYVFYLSIFSIFLNRITGEDDIIFSTPVSLRRKLEFENVLGCFVDISPIRFNSNEVSDFSHLLKSNIKQIKNILSLEKSLPSMIWNEENGKKNIFYPNILFAYNEMNIFGNAPFSMSKNHIDNNYSKFQLTFSIIETEDECICEVICPEDIFSREEACFLFELFNDIVDEKLLLAHSKI